MWVAYTQAPQPSKLDTVKLKDDLYVIHNDYVPGNSTALITVPASLASLCMSNSTRWRASCCAASSTRWLS